VKISFARHGESTANTLHVFSNQQADHPLTEKGRGQAWELAQRLKGEDIARIFSSPIPRAIETAEIVCRHLQRSFQISDALSEFNAGILEGKSDENSWAEFSRLWEAWFTEGQFEARIEGGESLVEIRNRLKGFIEGQYAQSSTPDHVLCFTHGGVLYASLPGMLPGIDYEFVSDHLLGNTELVIVENQGDGWICRQWGKEIF
jgi:broad specificity phosphatase PhoE